MRKLFASYLKLVAFSVAALGLVACVKLAPADTTAGRPEPRFGEPPQLAADVTGTAGRRIEALEDQIEALNAELASLLKALDVMGPLPEQDEFFLPVAPSELAGDDIPMTDPATEASARLAQLYAPSPALSRARSLFHEAELGSFRSKAAAEEGWRRLARDQNLVGLTPRYTSEGSGTRLTVGPLASEAAVDAICVELSGLAGQCRVAAPVRAY